MLVDTVPGETTDVDPTDIQAIPHDATPLRHAVERSGRRSNAFTCKASRWYVLLPTMTNDSRRIIVPLVHLPLVTTR